MLRGWRFGKLGAPKSIQDLYASLYREFSKLDAALRYPIITAGQIQNAANTAGILVDSVGGTVSVPSTWTNFLNLGGASASSSFLKHAKLDLRYDGTATFGGVLDIVDADLAGFSVTNVGNVSIVIRDSQIAHGMTEIAPTTVGGVIGTTDLGGLAIAGFSDSALQPGIYIAAHTPDPTGTDAGAIFMDAFKKSGTSRVNYASDEVAVEMPAFRIFGGRDNTAGKVEVDRQIQASNGSSAAPSYAFVSSTSTGMYRSGADEISFATGGTQRVKIGSTIKIDVLDDGNGVRVSRGTVDLRLFDSTTEAFMGTESNHNLNLRRNGTTVAQFTDETPALNTTALTVLANLSAVTSLQNLRASADGGGGWYIKI